MWSYGMLRYVEDSLVYPDVSKERIAFVLKA